MRGYVQFVSISSPSPTFRISDLGKSLKRAAPVISEKFPLGVAAQFVRMLFTVVLLFYVSWTTIVVSPCTYLDTHDYVNCTRIILVHCVGRSKCSFTPHCFCASEALSLTYSVSLGPRPEEEAEKGPGFSHSHMRLIISGLSSYSSLVGY